MESSGGVSLSAATIAPTGRPNPPPTNNSLLKPSDPEATADASGDSTPAASEQSQPQLNTRSCVTCRRRKVRCSKRHPCSNCTKANIECVFPGPGRAPRKTRKPRDSELLARLRTLESIVKDLNGSADGEHPGDGSGTDQQRAGDRRKDTVNCENNKISYIGPDLENDTTRTIDQEFGKLVIGDGKSQYVSHTFWTSFGDTIEELKDILDPATSDDEEDASPGSSALSSSQRADHDGFLFGFWSLSHSLLDFHPPLNKVDLLWNTYCENVAPVVPIFHRPTLQKLFYSGAANLGSLNKNIEVMMFSVYYTTITAMTPCECFAQLGEDRDIALSRYRFAFEQAAARANLLDSQSFILLQSLVLFLFCVRQQDDSRYVWSMTSIASRLAQGIGIHRDGASFGLTPFQIEMRRRLWWHICVLDFRAAEDHGCDPSILEGSYDTELPLNIDDEEISPETKETPNDRVGCTDMTFALIRFEVIVVARTISYVAPGKPCRKVINGLSLAERERMIEDLNKHLENRYVRHCDMRIPMHWVCAIISRLIIAKLWLMVYRPMNLRSTGNTTLPEETHNRLFLTSIEIIEFSRLIETNSNTVKWSWLFRTHMQWHAVAFLLSELCVRPLSPGAVRAWSAINSVYEPWGLKAENNKGMLWPAIRKLMARALKLRQPQLQQGNAFKPSIFNGASHAPQPTDPISTTHMTLGSESLTELLGHPQYNTGMEANPTGISSHYHTEPTTQFEHITPLPANDLAFSNFDTTNLSSATPSWDDWNNVVREFKLDVTQGDQEVQAPLPDWFE